MCRCVMLCGCPISNPGVEPTREKDFVIHIMDKVRDDGKHDQTHKTQQPWSTIDWFYTDSVRLVEDTFWTLNVHTGIGAEADFWLTVGVSEWRSRGRRVGWLLWTSEICCSLSVSSVPGSTSFPESYFHLDLSVKSLETTAAGEVQWSLRSGWCKRLLPSISIVSNTTQHSSRDCLTDQLDCW